MTVTRVSEECRMVWRGPLARALTDPSRYLDVEGAIRSGKTTMALWKVLNYVLEHPGIRCLVSRYSDDNTMAILRPVWRDICAQAGQQPDWVATESFYRFVNGSMVYFRGLHATDEATRYAKLRGLTLAVIYVDQAEELPMDYWPELCGRLSQRDMPQQLILTPNPPDHNHWIAKEFSATEDRPDHRYIRVSTYDNAANVGLEYIQQLERAYPPGHAKRGPLLLGLRGLNVKGTPVYGGYFRRELHVGPTTVNPHLPLLEAIDFGRHHPCVIWAQLTPYGGCHVLGGVLGQDLFLEDFIPILLQHRADWFSSPLDILSCCDPAGSHGAEGLRRNAIQVLREAGIGARWQDASNAPDVRRGAIERLAGYMRRRTVQGEGFRIDDRRWAVIGPSGIRIEPFLADGCEAGYVWDDRTRQVGNKTVTVPVKDGWFEHGQNCLEYLELNFGGAQLSAVQVEQRASRLAGTALRRAQRDPDPWRWGPPSGQPRAGY